MRALIGFIFAALFLASPAFAKDVKAVKKATAKKSQATKAAKVLKKNSKAKRVKMAKHATKMKKGKFKIRILSFRELARLPKAKRMKYVKDIREILVLIEGYQRRYEVANNSYLENLKKQFAWFLLNANLVPEANAADDQQMAAYRQYQDSRTAAARTERLRRLSRVFPVFNGNDWTCGEGLRFDRLAGTCYLEDSTGMTTFAMAGAEGEACPTALGFREVPHVISGEQGGSAWIQVQRACVPNGSWDKLTSERQAQVGAGAPVEPHGLFLQPYSEAQVRAATGGTGISSTIVPTPAPTGTGADQVVEAPAAPNPTPEAAVESVALDAEEFVDAEGDDAGRLETGDLDVDADASVASTGSCQPSMPACLSLSPEAKVAAISRFRSNGRTDDAKCVSGGFLSSYTGGRKIPGGCQIITRLPHFERFGDARPSCSAGGALCNPAAFCLAATQRQGDVEVKFPVVYCVDIARNPEKNAPITEACNTEYARMLEGRPHRDGNGNEIAGEIVPGFPGVVPQACDSLDPELFKGANFQPEWDQLRADTEALLNNWCSDRNPDLQALFCRECQILMERLARANQDAGASSCATDVPAQPAPQPETVTEAVPAAPAPPAPTAPQEPAAAPGGDGGAIREDVF